MGGGRKMEKNMIHKVGLVSVMEIINLFILFWILVMGLISNNILVVKWFLVVFAFMILLRAYINYKDRQLIRKLFKFAKESLESIKRIADGVEREKVLQEFKVNKKKKVGRWKILKIKKRK